MSDDRMWGCRRRRLLGEYREAGKLQQEFFHAYVGELHRGLGVIAGPRECHDLASSEARVLHLRSYVDRS